MSRGTPFIGPGVAGPRLASLLVKPAGDRCNLACTYCFYRGTGALFEGSDQRMSDAVLEAMTAQALVHGADEVSFVWQGGEPTLMGPAFYARALELQARHRRPGQAVHNALMTNGLLLEQEGWLDLLRRGEFLVGLSLDGPRALHDRYRRFADGRGSFARVTAVARRLLAAGIPVNAVVLATAEACSQGEAIYRTLTGLGFRHLQLVPCVEWLPSEGGAAPELAPFSVTPEGYARLLEDLFRCWSADFVRGVPGVSLRWHDSVLQRYLGFPAGECTLAPVCGGYLVVEHTGDVFPCDFFVDAEHRLGNLLETPLQALHAGEGRAAFAANKGQQAPLCATCRWQPLCQGGCPADHVPAPGGETGPTLSHLCPAYQRFFERTNRAFLALAQRWQAAQAPPREKIGRNAPCPCGSGNKYKRCCGR